MFRVQGSGCMAQDAWLRVQGVEFTSVVVDERRRLSMVATALWTVPTNATAACAHGRFHGFSPSELGTYQTVKGRFWSWLSGENPSTLLSFSLFARKRPAFTPTIQHLPILVKLAHTGVPRPLKQPPPSEAALDLVEVDARRRAPGEQHTPAPLTLNANPFMLHAEGVPAALQGLGTEPGRS